MKKNILITSIGGHFSHDLIRSLKSDKSVYIIGTDINYTNNSYYIDKFLKVPDPRKDSNKFIINLLNICKKYKINFVLPCSENECIIVSKLSKKFKKLKIKTSVSDYEIVKKLVDKHNLFKFLDEKKINVGMWNKINTIEELNTIAKKLGYPKKKLVLKPRKGSGSKGVIILDSRKINFEYLLTDKKRFCGTGSITALKSEIKKNKRNIFNYMIMPYYNKKTFDVDCLAKDGEMKLCVPRLRIYQNPLSPTNEGCMIINEKSIQNYCRKIIKVLNIDGVCDFDIILKNNKEPKIIDASCRLSGSATASLAAGINIPQKLINLLSGKNLKNTFVKKKQLVFPQNRFELVK